MKFTYRKLLRLLQNMEGSQLDDTVTIYLIDTDEVHGVADFVTEEKWEGCERSREMNQINHVEDVLEHGHPFMTVKA